MRQRQSILVPIDFSPESKRALEFAVGFADLVEGDVDVLHVWQAPLYVTPSAAVLVAEGHPPRSLEMVAEENARSQMEALLKEVEVPPAVELQWHVEFGDPASTILSTAENYDLIVLGTHQRPWPLGFFMHSAAEQVVRLVSTPVITVPSPAEADASA